MTFDSRKPGSTKYYLLGVGKSSICLGLWKGPGGEADVQGSKKWQDTHWRYIFCQVFPYFKGQSGTPHWIWDPPSITTKYSTAVDLFFCYYYRCWRARAVCLWTHYWKTMLLLGQWHYCHKEKIYCFAIATALLLPSILRPYPNCCWFSIVVITFSHMTSLLTTVY